jgi:endoglucanase
MISRARYLLVCATALVVLGAADVATAQETPPTPPTAPTPTEPAPAPAPAPAPFDPRGVDPLSPNPLAGLQFLVNKRHPSWRSYRRFKRKRRKWAAGMVWKVAKEPKFQWFGRWNRSPGKAFRSYLERSRPWGPGRVPLIAVLRHQGRTCGPRYDGGGPREDARTRRWYRRLAKGIRDERVVIAFEPDSLGTVDCLARHRRFARLKLLRYGVDVLSQLPNATIYLEGGASDWEPAHRTAWQLRYIGIHKVRGFMLNVTHYDWTSSNIRHGLEISRRTGGKHFVISTAFNGRGPVHYRDRRKGKIRRINVWCHPLRRGLGPTPTTATHRPDVVDAYLWIGRPGLSGGSCNGGPLPVGRWWADRAIMFGKYATDWHAPPPGTRYGHHKRYTLRQLGG